MVGEDFQESDAHLTSEEDQLSQDRFHANPQFVGDKTGVPPQVADTASDGSHESQGESPGHHSRMRSLLIVFIVTLTSGLLFGICAARMNARPSAGDLSLLSLVRSEQQGVKRLQNENMQLKASINKEVRQVDKPSGNGSREIKLYNSDTSSRDSDHAIDLNFNPVHGPGVTVTLNDAPASPIPRDATPDDLVVHQQDINNVMNAMWKGGAEAMTVQGALITSRSVVRCIGNVIRVDGISYSPPYVISAIGNPDDLRKAIQGDPEISIYKSYVVRYGLGWKITAHDNLRFDKLPQVLPTKYACIVEDHGRK